MKKLYKFSLIVISTLLIGCGGGSDSSTNKPVDNTPTNNTPSEENETTDDNKSVINNPPLANQEQSSIDFKVGVDLASCQKQLALDSYIYVSTRGDDSSGDGSLNNPYKTVYHAVTKAKSGETVMIRKGTYVESNEIRIRVPNITITSYPNEWAIIDRSSSGGVDDWDSGIYLDVDSDGSTIKCLEVKGGFYALSTETKWDWTDEDKMGATHITVQNVKLHDSYADGVKIKPNCDDFNISYSEIYNSGIGQTVGDCNAEGIDNVNADRTIASNLYIHNTCSTGIYFKGGATNSEIKYSLIEHTGESGILLGFDTSPEYFDKITNPNMYEAINCKAHHNLIKDTKWAGIGLYASKNSEIYNNTIINSASIYYSPIYFGLSYQDWDDKALRPANITPSVHHNIIYQKDINNKNAIYIRHSDELGGLNALEGKLDIDYNCYFSHNNPNNIQFEDIRSEWNGDFGDWQQHIDGDFHSIVTNPKLDNENISSGECKSMGYRIKNI